MANYDAGEVTDREWLAATRATDLATYNANALHDQARKQLATYDMANEQNAKLRDVQLQQASRKAEADRFEAQRNLRNAMLGLYGTMGNMAMNSSTLNNVNSMLADRNDADNSIYWQQLQENRDSINNAYDESYNQNEIAKREAIINAKKGLKDIAADLAANRNNINPTLYEPPEVYQAHRMAQGMFDDMTNPHLAELSGYITSGISGKKR